VTARIELNTAHGIRSVDLIADDGTHVDSWEPRGGEPSRTIALAMAAEIELLRSIAGLYDDGYQPRFPSETKPCEGSGTEPMTNPGGHPRLHYEGLCSVCEEIVRVHDLHGVLIDHPGAPPPGGHGYWVHGYYPNADMTGEQLAWFHQRDEQKEPPVSNNPFRPGDKVRMAIVPPGVADVSVMEIGTCDEQHGGEPCGEPTITFADPETGEPDEAHADDFVLA
jgi:hypothetical protein